MDKYNAVIESGIPPHCELAKWRYDNTYAFELGKLLGVPCLYALTIVSSSRIHGDMHYEGDHNDLKRVTSINSANNSVLNTV